MMANKKLSQKDLRELMRQRKSALSASVAKIESPLAKYDSKGLCCVLCNVRIETETQDQWSDHITGVFHKNKLEQMRRKKQSQKQSESDETKNQLTSHEMRTEMKTMKTATKRKSDSVITDNLNIISSKILKTNNEHKINDDMNTEMQIKTNITFINNDSEDQANLKISNNNDVNNTSLTSTLPIDFFDNINTDKEMADNSEAKNKELISSDTSLPKGFFDNPLLDAKARHVQYKDPVDEEWEKFQKMISEETNVSRNIIEVDMEEIQIDRTLIEIDEQISNWSKVNELQNKAQELHNTIRHDITHSVKEEQLSEDEEEDDDEVNVFANWRDKRFLKS